MFLPLVCKRIFLRFGKDFGFVLRWLYTVRFRRRAGGGPRVPGQRRVAGHSGRMRRAGRAVAAERRRAMVVWPWAVVGVIVSNLFFVFMTDGGRQVRGAGKDAGFGEVARALGLGIETVVLDGHRMTSDRDIYRAMQLDHNQLLFGFDGLGARRRIEALPWVATAAVARVFPNTLKVTVRERRARVLWWRAGEFAVVDGSGRVLGPGQREAYPGLALVSGVGAGPRWREIVPLVEKYSSLRNRVAEARLIGERRWSLVVQGGPVVHLPARGAAAAMARLFQRADVRDLLGGLYAKIDLRGGDGIVVVKRGKVPGGGSGGNGRQRQEGGRVSAQIAKGRRI